VSTPIVSPSVSAPTVSLVSVPTVSTSVSSMVSPVSVPTVSPVSAPTVSPVSALPVSGSKVSPPISVSEIFTSGKADHSSTSGTVIDSSG
jgi:hypothetical protein